MTDPFSIVVGVVGIATAAIQSSKSFLKLVKDIKDGPEEIRSVSRDVHAFYAVVSSLNATLKEVDVKSIMTFDEAMIDMIENLANPLENCQVVLEELIVKIQRNFKPRLKIKGLIMSATIIKWFLFTKSEIRGLQLRLEATNSTLCSALDAISTLCSMRLLAIGKVSTSEPVKWSTEPAEASYIILRLVEESISHEAETPLSLRASNKFVLLERGVDVEEISTARRQIAGSLTSFVQETQHAFMSEDSSLHRHFAQIYREISEQRMQLQQLKSAIEQPVKPKDELILASNETNGFEELMNPTVDLDNADDDDSATVEIFFDCVSMFSLDDSSSTTDRLYAKFSGSPDYCLELKPSFFPEQYSTERTFSESVIIFAMKTSLKGYRKQKFFLMYAENPRKWRKVTISVTFSHVQEQSIISHVSATDNRESGKTPPKALQEFFNTFLPQLRLFNSVSSLSLSLKEDESGHIISESRMIEVAEDILEDAMSGEDQLLQDIENLGCAKFLESQITTKSQISSSYYNVRVETREFIERKAPFASAGEQGENAFQDFFEDLKLLNSLCGCIGVVQFIGVVLDDTRLHLRSYLYEAPTIMSLRRVFLVANSRSEIISWPIWEVWSCQIIKAVSEIHRRGIIIGMLGICLVGLKADGSAVLKLFQLDHRHVHNEQGAMPPELRDLPKSDDATQRKMMNFRTDIFQLGYILWLLAEHKSVVHGYLCPKSACTKSPRYTCDAEHANPIELPSCCHQIPPYFNKMIKECRSPCPRARPTAHKLAKAVPYPSELPRGMIELVNYYAPSVGHYLPTCDECGMLTYKLHYHCNVCMLGDFDLCPACVDQGIHCFVSEHRLMKRITRNGILVDGS